MTRPGATTPPSAPVKATKQRIVLVTRPSLLTQLLERHGTLGQAEYYLKSRGQSLDRVVASHQHQEEAIAAVLGAIETDRRRARVSREDLERFLFAADDVVVIVGQDGLVPNTAKYLQGQPVIGVNPDPSTFDGVLCVHRPADMRAIIRWLAAPDDTLQLQRRTMAEALREDGQRLLSLNEIFVGHRTHQSARYLLRVSSGKEPREERQSSSGFICATGTGCTGWARSIAEQIGTTRGLPAPDERRLAWFSREPFPSVNTGTTLRRGLLSGGEFIRVVSEMGDGGTIFADGIETDRLEFNSGESVELRIAERDLMLVLPMWHNELPSSRPFERSSTGLHSHRGGSRATRLPSGLQTRR